MSHSGEIPDCVYSAVPHLIPPKEPTPTHPLYLTNLDDQTWLRSHTKLLFLYKGSVPADRLRASLSGILVHYYPLAGRLRVSEEDEEKLQIMCNSEGALFVETSMDLIAEEFLGLGTLSISSWQKLLYMEEGQPFLEAPLLVVQVTKLRCGATILCIGISHCIADGFGLSQFLHDWASLFKDPDTYVPSVVSHIRESLRPRNPLKISYPHLEYETNSLNNVKTYKIPSAQLMIPLSFTFNTLQLSRLKNICSCTSFEALASHVWIAWVRSTRPPTHTTKLLFAVNFRRRLNANLPPRYYGNAFVLGCAETTVDELTSSGIRHGVMLIQEAKRSIKDDYLLSVIDFLDHRRGKIDPLETLAITDVKHTGFDEIDYECGKPLHVGALLPDFNCIFLPCTDNSCGITIVLSVLESMVGVFKMHMEISNEI